MNTIIIGAGIAGLSAAWQLLERGAKDVLVMEREALAFSHSSARNAAIFRPLETSVAIVETVERSAQLLSTLPGATDAIHPCGLLLVTDDPQALLVQEAIARQQAVAHQMLGPTQLYDKYPELEGGRARYALWLPRAGVLDIHRIGEALRSRVCALGGRIVLNVETARLLTSEQRVAGVQLTCGTRFEAKRVVIAAGAWAQGLGASCNASLTLTPYRRHLVFLTSASTNPLPPSRPVVWDLDTGVYFRPESGGVLACPGDHTASEPGVPTVEPLQLARLAELLPRLCPALQTYSIQRSWACLRTMSSDGAWVIGADPRVAGLSWLAGLGGQGMSAGLGAGELLANAVLDNELPAHASSFAPNRLCPRVDNASAMPLTRNCVGG